MPPKENESLGMSQEMILWQAGDRPFRTAQEITQYIESLPAWEQAAAIEHLRRDLVQMTLVNDQALHDIYSWALNRLGSANLDNSDNREAWRSLREAHARVRNRRREGRDALAGEGKWCTEAFWDDVVAPLTGASADVTDALRKIKKKGLQPIGVMQRGCLEMFNRLSGESKTRFRKDKFCTGGDLKAANLGKLADERLTQPRFLASMLQKSMTLDEYGFIWHHPPRNSIADIINQQRVHEARSTALKNKEFVAQDAVSKYNLRKREVQSMDEDDMDAVSDPHKVPVPAFKKPARGARSQHARKTSEMDEIFNQLNVVKTNVTRQRAESTKKKGMSINEWPSPNRLPIPVKNSTKTQNAIWEVIEKRVRGVTEKRQVDISKEAAQVMRLPAAQLVQEVEAIAKGLSRATATEDTMLVYTQCLLDAFRMQILSQKSQTTEISSLRTVIAEWHRRYHERSVTLIPGSINQGGVQLDHYDLSTLLLGDGYDGWLNGDLIHGILNITADRANQYIVPARAFDFWHQGNHPDNMFYVPDNHPNLVVMVHWGNHWAIIIADRSDGLIHYLDSAELPGRRQIAVASIRNFLYLHPGYNSIAWTESRNRSSRQTNSYDCGVWVIANAWAWMEGSVMRAEVGLEDRLRIGRTLLDAAQVASAAALPVPTDEVEYMGTRNLNAPSPRGTSIQSSRMPTPQARDLATTAQLAQLYISPTPSPGRSAPTTPRATTPRAATPSSGISSARSSAFSEGFQARMNEGLISTRRSPSVDLGNQRDRQGSPASRCKDV